MKKPVSSTPGAAALRQRAEQTLRERRAPSAPAPSEADARTLVHELQVHQIELEMQNEELQRAQGEAQQAAAKYTDLFDFAPVGYFVLDAHGLVREVNLAGTALLGLDRQRVAGQPFEQYVVPDSRPELVKLCHRMRSSEVKQSCEVRLLRHSQSPCDALIEGTVTEIGTGEDQSCRLAVRDITEIKKAQTALKEANATLERRVTERTAELAASEERFRLMLEKTQDYAIFMLDPAGRVTTWNTGAQRLKGYSAEEIIGKHFACFYPQEDPDRPNRELAIAAKAGHFDEEGWRLRKDGSRFWATVTITALRDEGGALRGFAKITRDITERKRAEERLGFQANLLANISEVVYATDLELRLTAWNHAAETIYGWKEEEVLGRTVFEVTGSKVDPEMRSGLTRELLEKGSVTAQIEHTSKSGTPVVFDSVTMVLRDTAGKVNGFVGVNRDITDRKRAEEALRESERRERERAEELAAMLDAIPTPVFIAHDPDCRHITGNRAADELIRSPPGGEASLTAPAETRPRHFKAVKDGRDLRDDELPAQRAARGIPVRDFEFSLVFDDGAVLHVLGYGTPLLDVEGRPRGSVLVLIDVTNQHVVEKALRESEERFRGAMDNMLEGCQILGRDWRYVYINDAAERHNRRPKEDLIGKRYMDVWPGIEATNVFAVIRRCLEEQTAQTLGNEFTFPDGTIGWFDLSIQPVPEGVFILSMDITARKRGEEDLRTSSVAALNVMEDAVEARQAAEQASAKLRASIEDLTRFNRAAVDRELRMIELKNEVNDLCATAGLPPKYKVEGQRK